MAQISLTDLVPNLTQEDIMPDTDESVIMIDPTVNAKAGEARSFSLVQIQELFNVLLKRSNVQRRLTENEEATRVLEEKVAHLEQWRHDHEVRVEGRTAFVDRKFENFNDQLEAFRGQVSVKFQNCEMNHVQGDNRYNEIKSILKSNQGERMDLFEKHERMSEQIKDQGNALTEKIDMNFQRLWQFTEDVEKYVQQTLEVHRKTIKNTKVELVDILDTK